MNASDLAYVAEELLAAYREVLLIDPFYKIVVEIVEGDYISTCEPDAAPLSWVIKLNPSRHQEIEDIQYSVVEGLLVVLFSAIDIDKENEGRKGLISRLSVAISNLLPVDLAEDDPEEG